MQKEIDFTFSAYIIIIIIIINTWAQNLGILIKINNNFFV